MTPQNRKLLQKLRNRFSMDELPRLEVFELIRLERIDATEQARICPGCGHTDPMCHHTPDSQKCPCSRDQEHI